MKKSFFVSTILAISLLSGCGSSTDSSSNSGDINSNSNNAKNSGKYSLWEYMTPANSHTNQYTILSNGSESKYKTSYSVKRNRVVEVSDYVSNEKTIYERFQDKIRVKFEKNDKPNGMYELKLYVNEGDRVTLRDSSCKLTKHINDFKLNGKHFNDVIEIKCGDKPGYYQKGKGEIAQINDPSKKSVRVLSK